MVTQNSLDCWFDDIRKLKFTVVIMQMLKLPV